MSSSYETLIPAPPKEQPAGTAASQAQPAGWWKQYVGRMSYLTGAAKANLERESRDIASAARPLRPDGSVATDAWGTSRVRSGMVVGSVQSGKTASMLAVCSHLLDQKADVIIVLAGTRVALWMQTLERLLDKLDGSTPTTAWRRNSVRELIPAPNDILNDLGRLPAKRYLPGRRHAATKAFTNGLPVILVIPKEDDHLIELGRFLELVLTLDALQIRAAPTTMIVLDDEADDASILDAEDSGRVTPKFIQRLWANRDEVATRHERLFATYVAYTATPQANFLQRSHNPLAPRDFAIALKVPLDNGASDATTYREPAGLGSFYCGGELFYERFRSTASEFVIAPNATVQALGESEESYSHRFAAQRAEMLGSALRAYFVGGALRLLQSGRRLSKVPGHPCSISELKALLPLPHSMLFHPSALKDDHFAGAWHIARWAANVSNEELFEPPSSDDSQPTISVDGLIGRLNAEEDAWIAWVDEYRKSAIALNMLPGASFPLPERKQWSEIRRMLIEEVFPFTNLRVLNSDPRADDRPRFEILPVTETEGNPPADIFTIFVAGNVLSRGLTVDGLCTSLFLRSSNEPAADTQMQMQRWFGYRGKHLAYCKLFMLQDQFDLFSAYHSNDEALKGIIIRRKEPGRQWAEAMVLQGANFRATSKVDSLKAPLHPGPTPSIRIVETHDETLASANLKVLEDLLAVGDWKTIEQPVGTVRGIIRSAPLSMLEVAALLDRLQYSAHCPRADEPMHQRWIQMQTLLGLPASPFNPPKGPMTGSFLDPGSCPYSIAAYLKLWHSMLDIRDARGLFPTDSTTLGWNMIDLAAYKKDAPQFYVAVRFGEAGDSKSAALRSRGVKLVRRSTQSGETTTIKAFWGTRGVGGTYYGDQMIDYHYHNTQPIPRLHEEPLWRQRGHPGLLLFYVTRSSSWEQPVLGLAIPHGGPDHIAALRVSALS